MSEKIVRIVLPKESPDRSYSIHIGRGIVSDLKGVFAGSSPSKCVLVSEESFRELKWFGGILPALTKNLACPIETISMSGGEGCKDLTKIGHLWKEFQRIGLDRKSLIVNVGGGALSDAVGFAASTYMRGVSFVNIPTTLLSQVDASIGGKVAIDHSGVKNLVGSFAQPKSVVIDLDCLETLPEREYRSGFAEIVKHGLIADSAYLEKFENAPLDKRTSDQMSDLIHGSCVIKGAVVSQDETENGLRKTLNFGHTIGHAIESISHEKGAPLLHGEAISLGLIAEAFISHRNGLISLDDVKRVSAACLKAGLPVKLEGSFSDQDIISKISSDKKNVGGEIRWVLLEKIGKAIFDQKASPAVLKESLEFIRNG